jgi:hypothetical protein
MTGYTRSQPFSARTSFTRPSLPTTTDQKEWLIGVWIGQQLASLSVAELAASFKEFHRQTVEIVFSGEFS